MRTEASPRRVVDLQGQPQSAARGGAALLLAAALGNICNYAFTILAGRALGPADYGVLTALMALLLIAQLPMGAVQLALARDVSVEVARGRNDSAIALVRSALRMGAFGTLAMTAAFVAAMAPLAYLLQLDDMGPLAVTGLALVPTLATLMLMGDLQGRQRYDHLGAAIALPSVLRLALFGALFLLGVSLYGALIATVASGVLALGVTAWWTRDTLRVPIATPKVDLMAFLRHLAPVALGILAVTSLTNVDVLMVKGRLSAEDAGIFSAASNLAKLGFFIPLAIVGVLFPRVSSRRARGLPTEDILGRAILITLAFCLALFGTYIALGDVVVDIAFGAEFADATALLAPYGVGMTCFSLANILVSYELSLGNRGYAAVLAVGAAVQVLLLSLVPASLANMLWVNAVAGVGLIAAYQLQRGGLWRALQLGVSHARRHAAVRRRTVSGYQMLMIHRRTVVEGALVVAGMAAVAVIVTWPLTPNLGGGVFGGGDSFGTVAWLWNLSQEGGYSIVGSTPQTLTGAPFGWEQGNGVNIQWFIPYFPAHLASGIVGDVAAYNLVILTGITLSGVAMYAVVRSLSGSRGAATWAGIAFATFPWLLTQADFHGGFTHVWGFPLLVLAVSYWRAQPSAARTLPIAAGMIALCLTSGYYGLMGLVMVAVLVLVAALGNHRRLGLRRGAIELMTAVGAAVGGVLLIFAISRLGSTQGNFGTASRVEELQVYGARIHEFVVPPIQSTFFGDRTAEYLLPRLHGSNPGEMSLYLGLITLGLALAWLTAGVVRWSSRTPQQRYLLTALPATALAGLLMALPHPMTVGGREIAMPARVMFAIAPEFRVQSRFTLVIMTAVVIMAAMGLAGALGRLAQVMRRRGARRPVIAAGTLAVVALMIAASQAELATDRAPWFPLDTPPEEYSLVAQAPAGTLAEYPLVAATDPVNSSYLVQQRRHLRRLLNGGPVGSIPDGFRSSLTELSAPGTAGALASLGVSVVTDRRGPQAEALGLGYRLLGRTESGVAVWTVTADPSPAISFASGFGPPEPATEARVFRWAMQPTVSLLFYAPIAGNYRATFEAGSYGAPRSMRLIGAAGVRTVLAGDMAVHSVDLELPRGLSRLTIEISPGPEPIPDGRRVAVSMSDWTVIPAPVGANALRVPSSDG
jgi:O-antigen/teichoic acid export membrane protein